MTTHSGTATKARALILLMILAVLTPLVQLPTEIDVENTADFEPQSLELGERNTAYTGGRAPCPSTQSDGGFNAGDAPGNNTTTLSFGTDPSTAARLPGCVDTTDTLDFYMVNLTAGKDFTFELTVPTGADFDLYLMDTSSTILQASEYNDPLENFVHITNNSNAGTYYVVGAQYSSDGGYFMEMWTNSSVNRPDLTVSSISGPSTATTGSTVTVSYTVNNIGAAALNATTPYDIPVILSTDTAYDSTDTILNVQITGPNLAAGASQTMNSNVPIPSTLSAGSYYWIVWPDGYGNVTETNELNNNNFSTTTTAISTPGGATGDMFEPNENTTTATVVSTLPFSYSNLSIHTTTDDDYFAIPMISGTTYWINNTHTYANGDLDMDLMQGTIMLGSGASSSDNESITHTASGNFTAHLYIYGWLSATNNYGLTIEDSLGGSTAGTPVMSVNMPDKFSATADLTNLTAGASYVLDSTLYEFYIDGTSANTTLTPVTWTASSTTYIHNYSFKTANMEGQFAVITFLYQNRAFSTLDVDYVYYEMLEVGTSASDAGWMHAQNLTVGQSYSVQWWAYDNVTNSTLGSNTVNFTASSTSWYQNVSWTYPTTANQHNFEAILSPTVGIGGGYVCAHYEEFVPSPPAISITTYTNDANATTNSVTTQGTDLAPGNGYMWQITIQSSNNTTIASSGLNNVTATGNTMGFGAWTYNTPSSSGQYCAIAEMWTANGSQLMGDTTCFTYIYDADSDGVWDSNALCPNTPIGSTVDQYGCAASQRDTDGDGYTDDVDDFPNDPTQWNDTDGDGYGDNASGNYGDDFPLDPTQWSDADGDGCGDNPNGTNGDQFPFDPTQCHDQDGDG